MDGMIYGQKSWKMEVIADSSGEWVGNGLRFTTKELAEQWARDLFSRWTAVKEWRVVESTDPVNKTEAGYA
jgi:hypothetical protein